MNAITLIWRQVLKELNLFQMKENKEDAVEKTDKELQKTLKCHEDKYKANIKYNCYDKNYNVEN